MLKIRKHFQNAYRLLARNQVRVVSVADALPDANPTVLLPEIKVETPETASMTFESFSAYLNAPSYTARAVRSYQLTGALFCPVNECLVTSEREVFAESTGPGARGGPINPKALHIPEIEHIPGVAVPLRCLFNDYYHLLIDILPRFDLLHHGHFRMFDRIHVLHRGDLSSLETFFLSRLAPDNVTFVSVAPGKLYCPDVMLLNEFVTQRSSGYLRGPFIDRLHHHCGPPAPTQRAKRIYISRSQAVKGRRILNEAHLTKALRSYGFEAVVLEHLPIEHQIDLFRSAECVVAPHGAGLANLVFASHTKVLELFASSYVVPHYYMLAKSLGHRYDFVVGNRPHHDDNFSVDITTVLEKVDRLLR